MKKRAITAIIVTLVVVSLFCFIRAYMAREKRYSLPDNYKRLVIAQSMYLSNYLSGNNEEILIIAPQDVKENVVNEFLIGSLKELLGAKVKKIESLSMSGVLSVRGSAVDSLSEIIKRNAGCNVIILLEGISADYDDSNFVQLVRDKHIFIIDSSGSYFFYRKGLKENLFDMVISVRPRLNLGPIPDGMESVFNKYYLALTAENIDTTIEKCKIQRMEKFKKGSNTERAPKRKIRVYSGENLYVFPMKAKSKNGMRPKPSPSRDSKSRK